MSRPVGGVLFTGPLPGSRSVTIHLCGLPGTTKPEGSGANSPWPRLTLLRMGFTKPTESPRPLVRSYRTVSPLPVIGIRSIGGLFSVALSCGFPRLAVSQHPVLWSPDLPQPIRCRNCRGHPVNSPEPPTLSVADLLGRRA